MISMMAMIIIIRSDEGLMLETSALQTFHRGKSTSISARLIKLLCYEEMVHRYFDD